MTFLLWVQAVWAFIKKYWVAIAAFAIALIGFLLGFEVKKKPVIVTGVDPVKNQAEAATAQADQVATQQAAAQVAQAQQQAAQQDATVVKDVSTETQKIEMSTDPTDQTNDYLKQVSQEISGGPTGPTGGSGG
jgi:preprotein translocase subunit SecF